MMMKQKIKPFIIIMFFLIAGIRIAGGDTSSTIKDTSDKTLDSDKVFIGGNIVSTPLGKVMLVRKDSQYCAIKFTKFLSDEIPFDCYANYESYYQGDGTGDFSKKNVQLKKEQLAMRRTIGLGKTPFSCAAGPENLDVKCGPIKLFWSCQGTVYFRGHGEKEGDYGIELSPTKWDDISQVNVFDSRLKWYRYDGKRKDYGIPIDQLWEDKENKKTKHK